MPLAHQRCAKWMLFTHQALFPISLRTCTACTLATVVTHSAGSPSASCYRFVFLVIYASPHTTRTPCSRMLSRCPALKWVCAHVNGSFKCAPCRSAPHAAALADRLDWTHGVICLRSLLQLRPCRCYLPVSLLIAKRLPRNCVSVSVSKRFELCRKKLWILLWILFEKKDAHACKHELSAIYNDKN